MITDIFEIDCSVLRINGWCVKEDASNTLTWSLSILGFPGVSQL